MGRDKHEVIKAGGAQSLKKARKHLGPPTDRQWSWITQEMLESSAFRSLSGNALKILCRLMIEHNAHGGTQNGNLVCTYKNFTQYGIRSASVAAALAEVEYKGFVSIDRGKSYKGEHEPNIYRLTWIGDMEGAPATNKWKSIERPHIDLFEARQKETAKLKRMRKMATKQKVVHLEVVR